MNVDEFFSKWFVEDRVFQRDARKDINAMLADAVKERTEKYLTYLASMKDNAIGESPNYERAAAVRDCMDAIKAIDKPQRTIEDVLERIDKIIHAPVETTFKCQWILLARLAEIAVKALRLIDAPEQTQYSPRETEVRKALQAITELPDA